MRHQPRDRNNKLCDGPHSNKKRSAGAVGTAAGADALKISDELAGTMPAMGVAGMHVSHLIASANSNQQLDEAARHLWRGNKNGTINDAEATYLQNLIQRRRPPPRSASYGPAAPLGKRVPAVVKHARQRSSDRERSWIRRGRLAASGALPPPLAASLTKCELAYARIVRDECVAHGRCALTLDEIAARAGFERKAAQRAQRRLVELKLITATTRKQSSGWKNLPNVLKIVSREWLTWIARGPHTAGQKCPSTGRWFSTAKFLPAERPQRGRRGRKFARSRPPPRDRGGGDG
jgi:hypothetical protein